MNEGLNGSCRNSLQSKSIWLIATEQQILFVPLHSYPWTNIFIVILHVSFCDPKSGNTILLRIIFGTVKTGTYIWGCIRNW